jgi:Icc-related predicted phosphoesterase
MSALKLVFVSDTHGLHDQLVMPDGDILVHCGDATNRGTVPEFARFNQWCQLMRKKYRRVIYCGGNHDALLERSPDLVRSMLLGVDVLVDQAIEVEGLVFYGSPWTPAFLNWHFQLYTPEQAQETWERIPDHVDVLVTHGPVHGILDNVMERVPDREPDGSETWRTVVRHVGCPALFARVMRVRPLLHACGHVHCHPGQFFYDGVHFLNASMLDDAHATPRSPIVVDVSP